MSWKEERGVHLDEPYTRQLRGKLRELRFYPGPAGEATRIAYYIATGRRIILLTVFSKHRRRERGEIDRAERAMKRCIAEAHGPRTTPMSNRRSWEAIKRERAGSIARRAGSRRAKEAFAIAERVREARERRGLTQAELAARIGSTQPALARLEAGGVTPTLDTLHRIAEALGLELVVDLRARRRSA